MTRHECTLNSLTQIVSQFRFNLDSVQHEVPLTMLAAFSGFASSNVCKSLKRTFEVAAEYLEIFFNG